MSHGVWHYDGVRAVRQAAEFVAGDGLFDLVVEVGAIDGPHPLGELVSHPHPSDDAVFGLKTRPGWRIGFAGGVPAELQDVLPRALRYGRVIDRIGLWPAVAGFAVLAAIALFLLARTPALVAQVVPVAVEEQLGDAMVGDFGGRLCDGPGGQDAIDTLMRRIDPEHRIREVRVARVPMVNAVTLPGGRIILFDPLVRGAKSPDEVAGVIAHEIGHVRNRDVLEALLRQAGLSVLLGGMEGHIGGYTNALLAASYSRGAEARADAFAVEALRAARVSPMPTAAFFVRLSGPTLPGARMLAYLASHPASRARAGLFAGSYRAGGSYPAALGSEQWRALREICASDPKAKESGWRF